MASRAAISGLPRLASRRTPADHDLRLEVLDQGEGGTPSLYRTIRLGDGRALRFVEAIESVELRIECRLMTAAQGMSSHDQGFG